VKSSNLTISLMLASLCYPASTYNFNISFLLPAFVSYLIYLINKSNSTQQQRLVLFTHWIILNHHQTFALGQPLTSYVKLTSNCSWFTVQYVLYVAINMKRSYVYL
jgi:hypothetical protein